MRVQNYGQSEIVEDLVKEAELDLAVPFTTPRLTQAAMDAANHMGAGLHAAVRLIKVQVVPFPMDLDQSPVMMDFIREQLRHFRSELPIRPEIRLAREVEPGLKGALTRHSLVILGYRRRPWRTREERLAKSLRHDGYHVILVPERNENA